MKGNTWRAVVIAVVLALAAAACGGDGDGATTTGGGSGDGLRGSIFISGSSTVEPISDLNLQRFRAANENISVTIEGPGTGDGFKKFCAGESDISDASRQIKDSEKELCEQNGVEYVELRVAIDGITVLTSLENDAVDCLAFTDLYALLGPESLGFGNWSDANGLAAELGAPNAPYPDAGLSVTAPGEESGTYDTFNEFVIEGIAEERGQEDPNVRPDYTASANDNLIIQGISGSPTSLGWVGYAFYVENQDQVKALAIDGGDGTCVEPTETAIADGSYPMARPLFIYVNTGKAAEKPELAAFVDYYLSDEGIAAVGEAGYVELEDYETTRSAWADR